MQYGAQQPPNLNEVSERPGFAETVSVIQADVLVQHLPSSVVLGCSEVGLDRHAVQISLLALRVAVVEEPFLHS